MTHQTIFNLLKTLEIPVAYRHFDSKKQIVPPFIVYREIFPDTFKADSITYYRTLNYEIELVTIKKDVVLEKSIEELLTNNNISYDRDEEIWDEEEKIYHNYFEI